MARAPLQPRPHAHASALPRPAGFALLRPASRPELDASRILTMSGTLAINLIAMGLLLMPLAMPPPAVWSEPKPTTTIRQIPIDPVVVVVPIAPPPKPAPHQTQPNARQAVAPSHDTLSTEIAVVSETRSQQVADAAAANTDATLDPGAATSTTPAAVQLEYLSAPAPKYPRNALLRRIEGTVLLQVLVGIDGRPLEVTVSQTSGNRELDEAARLQILKRWSFRPATMNGQPVQAIGVVPVAFNLRT